MLIGIVLFIIAAAFFSQMGKADRPERESLDPKWIDNPEQYVAYLQGVLLEEGDEITYTVILGEENNA